MLRRWSPSFVADESGGGTIFGLFWFALLVGICGLAVDITNGFRSRTMLQATADATALAAAIDLPTKSTVVSSAVTYASDNMGAEINGLVLNPAEVVVGKWDADTKSLDTDSSKPDAVMVTVRQSDDNSNPLPVNFLRIIGLQSWNVRAQAVAQRFIPKCLTDGLVARDIVDISSNNYFTKDICVHGQKGVQMQNHNRFDPGTYVSMPHPDGQLQIPAGGMESNPGLPQALREDILDPRDVNHVEEIMLSYLDMDSAVIPSYIDKDLGVKVEDEKFDLSTAVPQQTYHIACKPNKNAQIPSNTTVHDVVIIADCGVQIGAGAYLYNVVIGSRSGGNGKTEKANVSVSANVQLGDPDNCADGGEVEIYSNATIHTAASTGIDGVKMVAAGDIELGARDEGINGISAQSGGKIKLTSNNEFGLCSGGVPDSFTIPYYRLVL